MHLLEKTSLPIIFAHRGASRYAPENTMAAFKLAMSQGSPAIELDTMLSKDLVPMVIHDYMVDRVTNGKGRVDQMNSQELLALDAGSWFSKEYSGERIPLLYDVLSETKKEIIINIELKNYHAPHDPLPEIVADLVDSMSLTNVVLYSSFLPKNLSRIKKKSPGSKVALLSPRGFMGKIFRSGVYQRLSPDFLHPCYLDVTEEMIEKQHQKGRRIHAWVVNDPDSAMRLFRQDVDGIITDDPLNMIGLISTIKNQKV